MGTQRGRLSQKNIFWEKFHKHTPHRSKFYSQKSDKIKTSQRKIYIQGGAYKKKCFGRQNIPQPTPTDVKSAPKTIYTVALYIVSHSPDSL